MRAAAIPTVALVAVYRTRAVVGPETVRTVSVEVHALITATGALVSARHTAIIHAEPTPLGGTLARLRPLPHTVRSSSPNAAADMNRPSRAAPHMARNRILLTHDGEVGTAPRCRAGLLALTRDAHDDTREHDRGDDGRSAEAYERKRLARHGAQIENAQHIQQELDGDDKDAARSEDLGMDARYETRRR